MGQVEKECRESFDVMINSLIDQSGAKDIQQLVD